jgi:2'-5' RNA ligase
MITEYESSISHWQEWQQEYQFGVLLIFPPNPPLAQVNTLRAIYDPRSQAACDAHISLTVPLPRPMSAAHWSELESLVADIAPFPIRYGPLRHYLPYPGVCLAIEPQNLLDNLRRKLESASVFTGASTRSHPFSAHMTLAEFISVEQTQALMQELAGVAPTGTFTCSGVSYAVPDTHFHFTERKRLPFSQR